MAKGLGRLAGQKGKQWRSEGTLSRSEGTLRTQTHPLRTCGRPSRVSRGQRTETCAHGSGHETAMHERDARAMPLSCLPGWRGLGQ